MANDNGQFAPKNSAEVSDETIRRFLLGGLRASEQPPFEQRLLIDHALAARVRLAEFELADDYADESLSSGERERMEEAFLVSAERERKIRVSMSLRDRYAPGPVSSVASPAVAYLERLRSVVNFARPAWRFAFAAVIFILLFSTVWVGVKKEARIKEEIVKQFRRRRSPNPTLPVESNHPANNSAPDHQPGSSPMPTHEQTPTASGEIISLTPLMSPDAGKFPSLNLPQGGQGVVQLRLALTDNQPGRYRAELLTIAGSSIFSAEALQPAGGRAEIDFEVPAQLLKTGDYQIRLGRAVNETTEGETRYYFRVLQ